MKKIIWVGMNKNGGTYVFTGAKPIAKNGELHGNGTAGTAVLGIQNCSTLN